MLLPLIIILLISVILAVRSMRDWGVPGEIKRLVNARKVRGSFVIIKNKIKHFRH